MNCTDCNNTLEQACETCSGSGKLCGETCLDCEGVGKFPCECVLRRCRVPTREEQLEFIRLFPEFVAPMPRSA